MTASEEIDAQIERLEHKLEALRMVREMLTEDEPTERPPTPVQARLQMTTVPTPKKATGPVRAPHGSGLGAKNRGRATGKRPADMLRNHKNRRQQATGQHFQPTGQECPPVPALCPRFASVGTVPNRPDYRADPAEIHADQRLAVQECLVLLGPNATPEAMSEYCCLPVWNVKKLLLEIQGEKWC